MSDDLIRRQDAIDAITHIISSKSVCINTDECHGMKRMQRQAVIELANLPSAQPDLSEHSAWFRIGETLVDESKKHITAEQAVDKIRDYMLRMKKPKPEPQWIPCSDGLPEPNEKEEDEVQRYYLVQNEYGDMMVAAYCCNVNGETWWEQMYAYKPVEDDVVAWMPLPEPWKGEQE